MSGTNNCPNPECMDGWVQLETGMGRCPECAVRAREAKQLAEFREGVARAKIGAHYVELELSDLTHLDVAPFPTVIKAFEDIADVVRSGQNVAFCGAVGCGKTQMGIYGVKQAVRAGFSGYVANVGWMSSQVRHRMDTGEGGLTEAEAIELIAKPDLLLLDDFGAAMTQKGDHERKILHTGLEFRHNNKKPTILTTNLNPAQLVAALGERTANRLEPLHWIHFNHGVNFRQLRAVANVWEAAA